jgi:hypothetical protein
MPFSVVSGVRWAEGTHRLVKVADIEVMTVHGPRRQRCAGSRMEVPRLDMVAPDEEEDL